MIRGTTPTISFNVPYPQNELASLYLTIKQGREVVIEKTLDDVEISEGVATCKLSQAETLRLDADKAVDVQCRIKTITNEAIASNIVRDNAGRILKDGEI